MPKVIRGSFEQQTLCNTFDSCVVASASALIVAVVAAVAVTASVILIFVVAAVTIVVIAAAFAALVFLLAATVNVTVVVVHVDAGVDIVEVVVADTLARSVLLLQWRHFIIEMPQLRSPNLAILITGPGSVGCNSSSWNGVT